MPTIWWLPVITISNRCLISTLSRCYTISMLRYTVAMHAISSLYHCYTMALLLTKALVIHLTSLSSPSPHPSCGSWCMWSWTLKTAKQIIVGTSPYHTATSEHRTRNVVQGFEMWHKCLESAVKLPPMNDSYANEWHVQLDLLTRVHRVVWGFRLGYDSY